MHACKGDLNDIYVGMHTLDNVSMVDIYIGSYAHMIIGMPANVCTVQKFRLEVAKVLASAPTFHVSCQEGFIKLDHISFKSACLLAKRGSHRASSTCACSF